MLEQLIFPGFKFGVDDPEGAERLVEMGVGGFCLYGGKIGEVAAFTRRMQTRARVPLLFSADYEDGIGVQVEGGTVLPSNMGIGAAGDARWAERKARVTAREARALGVRWIFAPVLDLATQPANPIVNVRSFGSDPRRVSDFGRAYLKGLSGAGVLSCVKHFPGHGETRTDSHLLLPVLKRTREQLLRAECLPFRDLSRSADSVMLAHLKIPGIGDAARHPASLSKTVVGGILRSSLRYSSLVVTDALSMRAIAGRYDDEEAALLAWKAGADVILVPADAPRLASAVAARLEADSTAQTAARAAWRRLLRAKKACGLFEDRGLAPEAELDSVGCAAHREEAEQMAQACLTRVGLGRAAEAAPASGGPLARREVLYAEPDADGPGEWRGKAFVEELGKLGATVRPWTEGSTGTVVVGSFVHPRAYSGRISHSCDEKRRAERLLRRPADSWLVSFGSPFVFDQIRGWKRGLCAFSDGEASQRAAARACMGRAEVSGRMPVPLKADERTRV
ncbi:MAG: hypothetical protein HY551_06715 [Elusimicrobia bacterium]|nr:hypothetical protein [Elusimicrobiota bacterium]